MKHRISYVALMSLVTLFGSQCTSPPDQSIIVTTARAPGDICDFSNATLYVEGGALDVDVYPAFQSYYQVFGWENDLENISVTVTQQITSETPNTFVATTIEDSYVLESQGPDGGAVVGPNPPPGLVSISATIAPGGTPTDNSVGVFLLTQSAMSAICGPPTLHDNCPNFPNKPITESILVTFQITGALVGGGATSTNPITFPVTLFKGLAPDPTSLTGFKPSFDPFTGACVPGYVTQTTSCGVPGRDIAYCVN
jgi:hypothetical protein